MPRHVDLRYIIFLSFLSGSPLHYLSSSPVSCLVLFYWNSPVWNHPLLFNLSLTICGYFYHTLDIERRARMALPNIWSICCFMGQTPLLKMPQGTLHFIFLPCTTRQVSKEIPHMKLLLSSLLGCFFSNQSISLSERSGELCPCASVQGSK